MLDFLSINEEMKKDGSIVVFPKFKIVKSSDLMIRGGDFYALWDETHRVWVTEEAYAIQIIDSLLTEYANEKKQLYAGRIVKILYLWDADSGMIDKFHKYCQKQTRDNYHNLDENIIFANHEIVKEDYASKKLPYSIQEGSIKSYDTLISVLYSPEERHKIEWAIGAIISGASKSIQKFLVLYGSAGTGKSTILNIIQKLFVGYYSVFDAKSLGSASNVFALEAFKSNPLVAIQHDGDLSRIEDNTRLNSLVSHEEMTVNEKFRPTYVNRFKSFLFMGTNKPVKITDAKSGLIRRLIDVSPTGNKVSQKDYARLVKGIDFELGAIAYHCKEVYLREPDAFDDYIPLSMMSASNDFYDFVMDSYHIFKREDGTTLKAAWALYDKYLTDAKVQFPMSRRVFKEELKNYFWEYYDDFELSDGQSVKHYYKVFRTDRFDGIQDTVIITDENWLELKKQPSYFDKKYSKNAAQYAKKDGTPKLRWQDVASTLKEISTTKLHWVKVSLNHIIIDFDLKDEKGEKSLALNLAAAKNFPPTYCEVSKSGQGIHLHYIYSGDVDELSRLYAENIEVKVYKDGASLRRMLTLCNDLPIATISSGLPFKKGDKKLLDVNFVQTEKGLRTTIKKNLNKEIHPATKPSIDHIYHILEEAYNSGITYNVSDLENDIIAFAVGSTNKSRECFNIVKKMKFMSKDIEEKSLIPFDDAPIVFFDIEIYPNYMIVCWQWDKDDAPIVAMVNPSKEEIEDLMKYKLVGYNNRGYDNHILWARMMGYNNEELYKLSQKIINSKKGDFSSGTFLQAYGISYTDVYDFASADNKKTLKKWEIELGIKHMEMDIPWDRLLQDEDIPKVVEYCSNDVRALRKVFYHLEEDWVARQILADLTDSSVNDTTNTLSLRAIFGNNKHPQSAFNYRNLALPVGSDRYEEYVKKFGEDYQFRVFNEEGIPQYRDYVPGEKLPDGWSILPFFPGYEFLFGKSTYLGFEVGEGGRVYSEPGIYGNVWDGDITSQHPTSIIMEVLFGKEYTKTFKELVDGRVKIKHGELEDAKKLFGGKMAKYIERIEQGLISTKGLAGALKTVINAIYGLSCAHFDNLARSEENIDNIVAKRGNLFMTLLASQVKKLGYTVCHIKTDSIKIPDADVKIVEFVCKFGKEFGYNFETEALFEKFCITNDSFYAGKTVNGEIETKGDYSIPYVKKILLTKENLEPTDLIITNSVRTAIYLDMNEELGPDEHDYVFVGKVGAFVAVKPGVGGGELLRDTGRKTDTGEMVTASITGTKGYRWMDANLVNGRNDIVDFDYYRKKVDDIYDTMCEVGGVENANWFLSDEPYSGSMLQLENSIPF